MRKVAIVGAGAWGTAISIAVTRAGNVATLWAREPEVVKSINEKHENELFLSGLRVSSSVVATNNLEEITKHDLIFIVVPSQFVRGVCGQLKNLGLGKDIPLVLCSKGIEQKNLKLMSEVAEEILPNPLLVMSGPTFASEVAQGLPASVAIACDDMELGREVGSYIESPVFKVFYVDDIIGAEIGGAMKNVIAIACGIVQGKQLGKNATAAMITRGVKEMKRLCVAKNGRPETLMELCGVGDLILTCNSQESRNMSLGYELGLGRSLEQIMENRRTVAEGVASSQSVVALAKSMGVELPICEAVNRIVHGRVNIEKTIQELISSS